MEEMIRRNLPCMFQIVFIEFNVINCNEGKSTYRNILNILEFIRLHCENHNRIFQTYLCYFDIIDRENGDKREDPKFYLINFILKIFKLIYDNVNFKLKKKEFCLSSVVSKEYLDHGSYTEFQRSFMSLLHLRPDP